MENKISSPQVVTVAVYLLGGDRRFIDTEDVAYKANELAPGRFAWRKYQDQINLELVRVYLSDAKKPTHGLYLRGSGSDGWMLTEKGLAFAKQAALQFNQELRTRTRRLPSEDRQFKSERRRLLISDAYKKFKNGSVREITRRDAENFFRLDDYVVGKARENKVARLLMMFSADQELSEPVKRFAQILVAPGSQSANG
jgi:hypothetical protein